MRVSYDSQGLKKALLILPFVALVREKTAQLTDILSAMNCSVKGYFEQDETGTPLSER